MYKKKNSIGFRCFYLVFEKEWTKNNWDTDGWRNILWGDYQPSLFNSICNNGGYMNEIWKCTRNKLVLVSIVSIVIFQKKSGQKMIWIQMEEEKYYQEIADPIYLTEYVIMVDIGRRFGNIQGIKWYQFPLFLLCCWKIETKNGWDTNLRRKILLGERQPSLLNPIFKIGGYRKQIQKHKINKTVLVYIVSVVCLKNKGWKMVATRLKEENYYRANITHQYYTQQPNKTKEDNGSQTYKYNMSLCYMISNAQWKSSECIAIHMYIFWCMEII